MDSTIRVMRYEDIPQVQYVAKESWHDTYERAIPRSIQDHFLKLAYREDRIKRRLEESLLYVAETKGEIIGFAHFSHANRQGIAELHAIYLLPEYQGKGVGTALLYKRITHQPNLREIRINVEKNNDIGKTFYDAKGFQVINEFHDHFNGYMLQSIRMVLTL